MNENIEQFHGQPIDQATQVSWTSSILYASTLKSLRKIRQFVAYGGLFTIIAHILCYRFQYVLDLVRLVGGHPIQLKALPR